MMGKKNTAIMILVLVMTLAGAASGGSIWGKRARYVKSYYSDDTARQVGDVLTIIISEESKVDNKVSRDLKKSTTRANGFNGELGIGTPNHNILPRMPGFTMSSTSQNDLSGQSDFSDERSIADRVTVVVQDVMPNGNLVVIGSRKRNVTGDEQTTQVSGIVRPSDISFNNTVLSEQIADFHMVILNDGVSKTYNEVGWLGKIMDALWWF